MNPPIGFEHVAQVDSTNAELMRRPFRPMPQPPALLLADLQTAGRGRNGRRWLSVARRSLTMSLMVEHRIGAQNLLGLPLAVGVAVADELARHGARPLLKWPNDIYCVAAGDPERTPDAWGRTEPHVARPGPGSIAKAGGILVEVRQQGTVRRIVIGCGLNLADSAAVSPVTAGQPVAALFSDRSMPDRLVLARSLGEAVLASVLRFLDHGLSPFAARWQALDWLAGQPIEVLHPGGRRDIGIACGIDDQGALRLDTGDRIVAVIAGDASVRRR